MNETRVQEALPFGFEDTSFQAAGGIQGIQRLVMSFYHCVDTLPEVKELRALYPEELKYSKEKLARYLCGWLGGPKKYQEKYGRIKIVDVHVHLHITPEIGEMWLLCMNKAIDSQNYSERFASFLKEQMRQTAKRIVKSHQL